MQNCAALLEEILIITLPTQTLNEQFDQGNAMTFNSKCFSKLGRLLFSTHGFAIPLQTM